MRYSVIDLSAYPVPDAIDTLAYEGELGARKAAFLSAFQARGVSDAELTEMRDILAYEFEPIVGLLEADAYRDLTMVARINDKVRAVMLATAVGGNLDHIGATYYRAVRRVITPANTATGAAAVMEDDETYRQRLALAPESWSAAGPEGAYVYFGMSASGSVLDLAVYSEDEGVCLAPRLRVPVLLRDGVDDGSEVLRTVAEALNRTEIRPLGDIVQVQPAEPLPYAVHITLQCRSGASSALVAAAARAQIEAYTSGRIRWTGDGLSGPVWLVGRRIRVATLASAARVDGVEEVIVHAPADDVNAAPAEYAAALSGVGTDQFMPLDDAMTAHLFRAPICTAITIDVEVISGGWSG